MSDGYGVYRGYLRRLRCWAHLIRKAKGLTESYHPSVREYGRQVLGTLNHLMDAVYQAREGPDQGTCSIAAEHQSALDDLRSVCESMGGVRMKKRVRSVGNFSMIGMRSFACWIIPPGP